MTTEYELLMKQAKMTASDYYHSANQILKGTAHTVSDSIALAAVMASDFHTMSLVSSINNAVARLDDSLNDARNDANGNAANLREQISKIAHGGVGGPLGFEALTMVIGDINGGYTLTKAVDAIACALDRVAENLENNVSLPK